MTFLYTPHLGYLGDRTERHSSSWDKNISEKLTYAHTLECVLNSEH